MALPPPSNREGGGEGRRFRGALGALLLAVVILNLPATAQEAVASGIQATVLRPFLALQQSLVSARTRAEAASVLQDRIDSLTAVTVGRTALAEENRRLRGLLELAAPLGPRWRAVEVLRPGTVDSEGTILLNAGRDQGVAPRSPIITREGLAGVVREVGSDRAVGMDWTHPEFRASAMTLDGLHYGIARSEPGLFREAARMRMEGLPYHAAVQAGDVVVTSGLGGVFPRGIPIGRVVEVADEEAEWQKSLWIEPLVAPGSVRHALVRIQGEEPQADLTPIWGESGYLRADERVLRAGALEDTLRILRDSLAVLRPAGGLPPGGSQPGGGS